MVKLNAGLLLQEWIQLYRGIMLVYVYFSIVAGKVAFACLDSRLHCVLTCIMIKTLVEAESVMVPNSYHFETVLKKKMCDWKVYREPSGDADMIATKAAQAKQLFQKTYPCCNRQNIPPSQL